MIILKRINKFDEQQRKKADQEFFLLLGKIQLLRLQLDKKTKQYIMDVKSLQKIEELNRQYNADASKSQSFESGYLIPNFVMLGTIISDPMPKDEAIKLCEKSVLDNGEVPVQVCINRKTNMAVLKNLYIPLDTFYGIKGKTRDQLTTEDVLKQTCTSLTHKCGEGFSRTYDTWINQKFFWLNTAVSLQRPGWQNVTAGTIVKMRNVTDGILSDFDKQCWAGNTSTCKWYSWGRDLLFDVLFWAGLAVGVVTFPIGGWAFTVAEVGAEVAIMAADMATSKQQEKSKLDDTALGIIEARLKSFGAGRPISNFCVGGFESYMMVNDRMIGAANAINGTSRGITHKGTCSKLCPARSDLNCTNNVRCSQGKYGRCAQTKKTKNHVLCKYKDKLRMESNPNVQGTLKTKENTWTKKMRGILEQYEKLPEAPWNCDELSKRLSLSWSEHKEDLDTCIAGDAQFICEDGDAKMRQQYK
jgi:hypothetical protein